MKEVVRISDSGWETTAEVTLGMSGMRTYSTGQHPVKAVKVG